MSTANMIYPDQKVAQMLMGALKKRFPDDIWEMSQTTSVPPNFQIRKVGEVVKPLPYAEAPKENGYTKDGQPTPYYAGSDQMVADLKAKSPVVQNGATAVVASFISKFVQMNAKPNEVVETPSKDVKSGVSFVVQNGKVMLKMSKAVALKKGLIK